VVWEVPNLCLLELVIGIKCYSLLAGDTLKIPDSVLGLTFLAAGMSIPEAVSSVIVTNQGKNKTMTNLILNLLQSFN